jgi:predicted ATP-dependent protease
MGKKPLPPHHNRLHRFSRGGEHQPFVPPPFKAPAKLSRRGHESYEDQPLTLFDLSSHTRAREAIEFGLKMRHRDFHVFVVAEDRSGRMTGTLSYLKQYIKNLSPPADWVYLNNFEQPHMPLPFALPAGGGTILKEKLTELITSVAIIIHKTLNNAHYLRQVDTLTSTLQAQTDNLLQDNIAFARERGFELMQTEEGFNIELLEETKSPNPLTGNTSSINEIRERLSRMTLTLHLASQKLNNKLTELKRHAVHKALTPLFEAFHSEYTDLLGAWVASLKEDILKNITLFEDVAEEAKNAQSLPDTLLERYTANVFVDNTNSTHPRVLVESNTRYENLFGSIKYRSGPNGVDTNFTMVRPGALHLANGGILVLRADALAKTPDTWEALKSALRDRHIRIEETHREGTLPILDAPEPKPIPLDVQVFLIASPYWYYTFYFNDPDFRSYFKIKADIDPDLPLTAENLTVYRHLIHQNAVCLTGMDIEGKAVDYLTHYSSRWVGDCHRLSARFEQLADILVEAAALTQGTRITRKEIENAIKRRRERNSRLEDRHHEDIMTNQILIDVESKRVGQVNGLTVVSAGEHEYGLPCRISARAYAGDAGVMNIERMAEMSGPIQQKGAMIIEGFLNGLFAQEFPLSYACSVTFEQSYVDIEGDSASLGETIAILSALSGMPVRQDIAVTGSMNQFGYAQSVGGVHHKVEGFYRTCQERGLTGTQGVIIPSTNKQHLTLKDDVLKSIKHKKFFIWTVDSIFDVIELLMGAPCGIQHRSGEIVNPTYPYPKFARHSVFAKAFNQLKKYHRAMHKSTARPF